MKKIILLLLLLFNIFSLTIIKGETTSNNLYIHYYRFKGDYEGWNIWLWEHEPISKEGISVNFATDDTSLSYNFDGVVAKVSLSDYPNATSFGLIIRKGNWEKKDIDEDRYFSVTEKSADGNVHLYIVEGERNFGYSLDDPHGPSRFHKFTRAYFSKENEITFTTTSLIEKENFSFYINDVLASYTAFNLDSSKTSGKITLAENITYTNNYKLSLYFEEDKQTSEIMVSIDGLFDTDSFNEMFYYEGELGAIYDTSLTTFKLWAPLSTNVVVNIYNTGTPLSLGGNDTPIETLSLVKGEKGVFSVLVSGDLHGKYYTYDVTNNGVTHKNIVDPYAKGVGVNGLRGLIVDFNKVNPEGWLYNKRAENITKTSEAIIYELHVRDLTTHETWNGNEDNRGMFLGLIEEGTKHNSVTTGFDHIKELGITHLQLLPIFDYGNAIDETKQHDPNYNSFNWGYMPLNFNALEGNYSKDPYDGLKRIEEFKQVVMAYNDAGIRINMDVVYNHTGQSADSNFNLIVPGYYYRFDSNGGFSNGSGTGNETASERLMMRKFIVDSTKFWLTEYNLGGFRFDLMALHDTKTMLDVNEMAKAIDPTIMIYGEPWTGADSTLPKNKQAGKETLIDLQDIAAFNDDTRDGLKGSVFSSWMPGFLQGDFSMEKRVKYGIVGGVEHVDNPNYNVWHGSPNKTLNYVSAHDNNTLHDKLYLSLKESNNLNLITPISMQAYGIILTSQGIPFLHAGDEFLRSKEIEDGVFDNNSYQSVDKINWIDWSLKEKNIEHYKFVASLIELRKENKVFTSNDNDYINNNLRFINTNAKGLIAYTLTDTHESSTYLIILNSTNNKFDFNLNDKEWIITNSNLKNSNGSVNKLTIEEYSFYVLKTNSLNNASDFNPPKLIKSNLALILAISITSLVLIASSITLLLIKKKK